MAAALVLACLAIFVSFAVFDAKRFLVTGNGITASAVDANNWRISTVRAISKAIDDVTQPGEPVMAFWPGYIFESKALPVAGFENNFGLYVSPALNPGQLSEYHIVSHEQVNAAIGARLAKVVVLGNQDYIGEKMAPYKTALEINGYRLVRSVSDASIYSRRDRID